MKVSGGTWSCLLPWQGSIQVFVINRTYTKKFAPDSCPSIFLPTLACTEEHDNDINRWINPLFLNWNIEIWSPEYFETSEKAAVLESWLKGKHAAAV